MNKKNKQNTYEKQVAGHICVQIRAGTTRVPSQATISRVRARVDVAYMMHFRATIDDMFDNHSSAAMYAMADKSPQGGREYEQVVLFIVKRCLLNVLQCLIQNMESRRARIANSECACLCSFVFVCLKSRTDGKITYKVLVLCGVALLEKQTRWESPLATAPTSCQGVSGNEVVQMYVSLRRSARKLRS